MEKFQLILFFWGHLHVISFIVVRNWSMQRNPTNLPLITDKLCNIKLYLVHTPPPVLLTGTFLYISIDVSRIHCKGICKSSYHAIATTKRWFQWWQTSAVIGKWIKLWKLITWGCGYCYESLIVYILLQRGYNDYRTLEINVREYRRGNQR